MTVGNAVIAVFLIAVSASTSPYSARTQAQAGANCARQFDQIERDTRAFESEVTSQNLDFVKNEEIDATLGVMKTRLADNPTAAALFDPKEKKAKFEDWATLTRSYAVSLEDLRKCLSPNSGCSLLDFAKQQNEALSRWIRPSDVERGGRDALAPNSSPRTESWSASLGGPISRLPLTFFVQGSTYSDLRYPAFVAPSLDELRMEATSPATTDLRAWSAGTTYSAADFQLRATVNQSHMHLGNAGV